MDELHIAPWVLVLAGFVAGLFGSLLGLGGGWLMVPALASSGLGAVASVGSSLAAMVATTFVSVVKYHRQGRLKLSLGLAFGLPAAVGVQIGKAILVALARLGVADFAVGAFYVGLLLVLGASMLRKKDGADAPASTNRRWRLPEIGPAITAATGARVFLYQAAIIGTLAGTLSGVLGIGGGILLVPILTGVFGFPVLTAVATSLISVFVSAIFGSISFALAGDWSPVASAWLAVGAVGGGIFGSSLAPHAPERALRRLFAALTMVVASSIVARLAGDTQVSLVLLFGGAALLGAAGVGVLVRGYLAARKTGAST